jgi:hypothetical protein
MVAHGVQNVIASAQLRQITVLKGRDMRRLVMLCATFAVFSVLALAESWTGRLVDASCYDQHKSATACDPSASTTGFALMVSGQAYKLDSDGNTKAAAALKGRADRSADPKKPATGTVSAKVTGTKEGNDTIKVESIDVQ